MKSNLGSQSCLKCGEQFPPREAHTVAEQRILVGELDLVDPWTRQPVRHHFKFHRKCFESFRDNHERHIFMNRAAQIGLMRS
jgi:hypothetical protein